MFGWNFHKTTQYLLRCCSQSIPKCLLLWPDGLGFPLLPVPSSLSGARGGEGDRRRVVWAVPGAGERTACGVDKGVG